MPQLGVVPFGPSGEPLPPCAVTFEASRLGGDLVLSSRYQMAATDGKEAGTRMLFPGVKAIPGRFRDGCRGRPPDPASDPRHAGGESGRRLRVRPLAQPPEPHAKSLELLQTASSSSPPASKNSSVNFPPPRVSRTQPFKTRSF